MTTLYVDNIEANLANYVNIPGHVIQVVQEESTVLDTTTSTSFIDTSLSGTITPTSASSKILIFVSGTIGADGNAGALLLALNRDATELLQNGGMYSGAGSTYGHANIIYLDSPSTTSAVTYTVRYKAQSSSSGVQFNVNWNNIDIGSETAYITMMEIEG
jgi:hypothetical protein